MQGFGQTSGHGFADGALAVFQGGKAGALDADLLGRLLLG